LQTVPPTVSSYTASNRH